MTDFSSAAPWPGPAPAERVRMAYQSRAGSDYIFEYWTALGWTVLTLGFYGLYVIYQLMRRMRDHNVRRLELLNAATAFAWEEAGRQGRQEELTPSFQRIAGQEAVLRAMTHDFREPVVSVILSVVARGIADVIAFVLLDQDLTKHDRAEGGIEHELALIYGRLGCPLPLPDPGRVKGAHNYVGRIIAAIFSFGIYMFWWFHDVMVEPNRHFQINWVQEDALVSAVQHLAATRAATS